AHRCSRRSNAKRGCPAIGTWVNVAGVIHERDSGISGVSSEVGSLPLAGRIAHPKPVPPLLFRRRAVPALAGFLLTLLAACLPSHGAAQTEPSIAYPVLSIEKLRGDFDQLRNLIMSRHPLIYANRQALDAEFAKQRELLTDGMNELEFFRVLSRLVSQVNCGHTSISLSSTTEQQTSGQRRYVPLVIEIVDGRLHVTGAAPEHADLIGREVVAINGRTSGQIIRQLYDAIPADGQ